MEGFKGYKDLKVWKKGIELVTLIYEVSRKFPEDEKFGLISQMRRAAISVPSNIAEGWGRNSNKSFVQFVNISRASLMELETQIIISKELGFIETNDFIEVNEKILELAKMTNSFISKLKN